MFSAYNKGMVKEAWYIPRRTDPSESGLRMAGQGAFAVSVAKQIADMLTYSRGVLALLLVLLGLSQGDEGLPLAVYLLLLAWTSDALDGMFARRSGSRTSSWIGEHDLQVDIAVSCGLLIYMVAAGLIDRPSAGIYALFWLLIFWRWGVMRSLGMLMQAPVYGWFIWVAMRDASPIGQWLIVWVIGAVLLTWPRFPQEVVPGFLQGMQAAWQRVRRPGE
jgi:phosphatidylglycerophosphate synthase